MKYNLPRPQLKLLANLEHECLEAIKEGKLDNTLSYLTPELTIEEFISEYTSNYICNNDIYEVLKTLEVKELIQYFKWSINKLDDIAFYALRTFFDTNSKDYLVSCLTEYNKKYTKAKALKQYLIQSGKESIEDIELTPDLNYDDIFKVGNSSEYRVISLDKANKLYREYLVDELWTFGEDILSKATGLEVDSFKCLEPLSEKSNKALLDIIKDSCGLSKFMKITINTFGRGRLLSPCNGLECKVDNWYIYKIN